MIVFTKKYKPLTAKLMFKLMLLSVAMIVIIPQILEILNYRMGIVSPNIVYATCAIVIALGVIGYLVGLVSLICSLLEKR